MAGKTDMGALSKQASGRTRGKVIKRWFLTLAAGLALVVSTAFGFVYLSSERYLTNVTPRTDFEYVDRRDDETLARGQHIARTRGCFGCHGQQLEGRVFVDKGVWLGKSVAPNLARYAQENRPEAIEAAVRQGIGANGKALWSMPSYNFALMSDEDLSALIAFLQSSPVVEKVLPDPDLGWEVRMLIVREQAQHMAEWASGMPPLRLSEERNPKLARGEYLAKTTCNECHGFDLRGQGEGDFYTPDLAMVVAYTDADFRRLMTTGEAIGGRNDLRLMSAVARDRFAAFTDGEISDLLAYLRTLPGTPVDHSASWRELK